MSAPDFRWLDPEDAIYVRSCREALVMERKAWEACHKERMAALDKLARIKAVLNKHGK